LIKCLETDDIPVEKYTFTPLGELEQLEANSLCGELVSMSSWHYFSYSTDVIAIVKEIGEENEIVTKQNRPLKKRDLSLVDQTGFSVRLTLWGRQAEQFQVTDENPLYAFKGVKVGDFGGRCCHAF
jgi:replication factor A1